MATTVTIKGQVTLPKKVREAVGIKPGDTVEVRATAAGSVIIEKPDVDDDYQERLRRVAKMRVVRGTSTDEIMKMTRGNPAADPTFKRK